MATWIAHMRIAEHFMNTYPELNNREFLVGNIGPDCGVPNDDWSSYTPDKHVTHWLIDGKNIDAVDFKNNFLNNSESPSFYLGYYFHLLTDIQWEKFYEKKKQEPPYCEGLVKDKNFIWTIKKDWYGLDHLYLQNNPQCLFFTIFANIDIFENNFFDFYPDDAFIRQIKYITHFYKNANENPNREFLYLKKKEIDMFVSEAINILERIYNSTA